MPNETRYAWLELAAQQSYAADNDRGGAPLSWLAAAVVNKNSAIEGYGQAAWDAAYARARDSDTHPKGGDASGSGSAE